jgi:hypothetical protein
MHLRERGLKVFLVFSRLLSQQRISALDTTVPQMGFHSHRGLEAIVGSA